MSVGSCARCTGRALWPRTSKVAGVSAQVHKVPNQPATGELSFANEKTAATTADMSAEIRQPSNRRPMSSARLNIKIEKAKRPAKSDSFPAMTAGMSREPLNTKSLSARSTRTETSTGDVTNDPGPRSTLRVLRSEAGHVSHSTLESAGGIRKGDCVDSGVLVRLKVSRRSDCRVELRRPIRTFEHDRDEVARSFRGMVSDLQRC